MVMLACLLLNKLTRLELLSRLSKIVWISVHRPGMSLAKSQSWKSCYIPSAQRLAHHSPMDPYQRLAHHSPMDPYQISPFVLYNPHHVYLIHSFKIYRDLSFWNRVMFLKWYTCERMRACQSHNPVRLSYRLYSHVLSRIVLYSRIQDYAGQKQVSGLHYTVRHNERAWSWSWNQARTGSNHDDRHVICLKAYSSFLLLRVVEVVKSSPA